MNQEFPDVQAGFREGRGTRNQIANIRWIIEKAREFQKNITSASLTMLKPLTVWITANCGKFLKTWEYQTTLPTSCKTYMQIKKKQLELDMEPQTASKLGKELCILSPCLFNLYAKCIMRNAELKEHKLESSLPGEISTTSDMQMTPPLQQKVKKN